MTWRKASEMPELFENAVSGQSIGYVSEPLESGAGFHLLKLEDKRGEFVKFEDQWRSRHVLLMPSAIRDRDETLLQLNAIRQRILDGEDFSAIAEEFSEDPGSAKQGGDLGWTGLGVFAAKFEQTILETEIGSLSEVFETEFGFHFLEVMDKRNHELSLEGALHLDTDVIGLFLGELGKLALHGLQVKSGNLLVQVLGEDVHLAFLVVVVILVLP